MPRLRASAKPTVGTVDDATGLLDQVASRPYPEPSTEGLAVSSKLQDPTRPSLITSRLKVALLLAKVLLLVDASTTVPELWVKVPPVLLNAPCTISWPPVEVNVPADCAKSPPTVTDEASARDQAPVPLTVRWLKADPPARI
jgi:hypothetical protein